MKTLKIKWLACDNCMPDEADHVVVQTEEGCQDYLYSGDKAECPHCHATGVIDADGDNAWVEWDEVDSGVVESKGATHG